MINRGPTCPKILAATHFHRAAAEILELSDNRVSFVHMQVVFSSSATGKPLAPISDVDAPVGSHRPGDKITHLYRYGCLHPWYRLTYRSEGWRKAWLAIHTLQDAPNFVGCLMELSRGPNTSGKRKHLLRSREHPRVCNFKCPVFYARTREAIGRRYD